MDLLEGRLWLITKRAGSANTSAFLSLLEGAGVKEELIANNQAVLECH